MRLARSLGRIGAAAAVSAASLVVGVSAPAVAATTSIGQLGGDFPCAGDIDAVQNSVTSGTPYAVPAGNWVVTSWSTYAGAGPPGSLQLEMWRPTGTANDYMLVGISPVGTTTTSGTNTFSLAAPLAVQGGDLLGLRNLTFGYACVHAFGTGGSTNAGINGTEPLPGEVRTIPPAQDAALNITATLQSTVPALQVKKVVFGTAPSGFTERVQCTTASVSAPAPTTVVNASLAFQADGTPDSTTTPAGWTVEDGAWQLAEFVLRGATCTVSETDTGGASFVSYSCSWTPGVSVDVGDVGCPGPSSGPSETPASVLFVGNGDEGMLTVTNTFPEPPLIPTVAPRFTG
jgi:hypothetical protein